jgi:maleate isomerase
MMNRRQFVAATTVAATVAVAFAPPALSESNEGQARWEADGVGSLARIGVLTPDDDPVPESEMRTMAPAGVSIHASRVLFNSDPLSFAEGADSAARLLTRLKPRLILYAFTSSSYVLGEKDDDHLQSGIEQRAGGVKVLFTCPVAVEGLRLMGARKVALIHPPWFAEALNAKGKEYFQGRGFGVVSSTSLAPARTFQEVPPAEVYEWTIAHTPPESDAVFIGGNGLRAIGTIRALEERLRRPVLTANQVLFWYALRQAGVRTSVAGYGRLFEH